MSQGSTVLPTTGTVSGLTMTQDSNAALEALLTKNSGAAAPANGPGGSPAADQEWADTATGAIWQRNAANSAWVMVGLRGYGYGIARGHLAGFTMSNNGATAIDVAAGICRDSTDVAIIRSTAAITTGTLAGPWAAGSTQNKLDTGAKANSTWYHVWVIRKDSDGSTDWLYSLSATAPTMPSGYTYKRRIGSVKTDGSGNILGFIQRGDMFLLAIPISEYNDTNPGTAAVLKTLAGVPTGVRVEHIGSYYLRSSTVAVSSLISCPDTTDTAPAAVGPQTIRSSPTQLESSAYGRCMTNTSAQIRYRVDVSDGNVICRASTFGWEDTRGRFD